MSFVNQFFLRLIFVTSQLHLELEATSFLRLFPPLTSETGCFLVLLSFLSVSHAPCLFLLPLKYYRLLGSILSLLLFPHPNSSTLPAAITTSVHTVNSPTSSLILSSLPSVRFLDVLWACQTNFLFSITCCFSSVCVRTRVHACVLPKRDLRVLIY